MKPVSCVRTWDNGYNLSIMMNELAAHTKAICGLHLTKRQIEALEIYENELLLWNARYNLTAITDPEKIRIKHFLDSLTCMCVMRDTPMERVIDVGTGAGFPGIPLKIVNPSMHLTLLDSVGKKTQFCDHIIRKLSIDRVEILQDRAEVIGQKIEYRQGFDWALARAVAVLPVLVEFLLPLVKIGGSILALKGESAYTESQSAERAIRLLGGHLREIIRITLPGVVEEHYLVVIDKVAATPPEFPRRVGIPAKKTLF